MIRLFEREGERELAKREKRQASIARKWPSKASVQHNSARNRQTQQKRQDEKAVPSLFEEKGRKT